MARFSREDLEANGFIGFINFSALKSDIQRIPDDFGIYVVYRENTDPPKFLAQSIGGWHKGKDPTRPVDLLTSKWIPNCCTVYIGKAGPSKSRTLRKRIHEYLKFGLGKPIGHGGGSAIWQIAGSSDLLVAWKVTAACDPREAEKDLITEFIDEFGVLPFANWQR